MKNVILAVIGLSFAMAFTSHAHQDKKAREQAKEMLAKQTLLEKEKHHRRW